MDTVYEKNSDKSSSEYYKIYAYDPNYWNRKIKYKKKNKLGHS